MSRPSSRPGLPAFAAAYDPQVRPTLVLLLLACACAPPPAQVAAPPSGTLTLQARCTNVNGEAQPTEPNWNAGGFMRNVIESVRLVVA